MKLSKQQKQTKDYFEKVSNEWYTKANLNSNQVLNIINQRNQYVKKIAFNFLTKNAKTLDVGCGTGELVLELLKSNYDAQGIDFSKSMIKKAENLAAKNNFKKNVFIHESFFEYKFDKKFDLISANGFIEYISEDELKKFLVKSYQLLSKNGILVINSRNRLFNVFSFNEFTKEEIKQKTLESLIKECIYFNSGKNFKQIIKNRKKLKIKTNLKKHSKTGINVDTRFQYTPFQLIDKIEKNHFKPLDIDPIHIHVFTTGARKIYPNLHNEFSNHIQIQKNENVSLIPQSSSFMLSVKKI